jgi:diguanylate cyclase (GGDEF)-like protein/PAS domain S-box-containing protein
VALARPVSRARVDAAETRRIRILLIEDMPTTATIVSSYVGAASPAATVECVETLADALKRIAGGAFDLVLADLNLPDSKGLDTLDRLVEATDRLVVVLTGEDLPDLQEAAIARGAYDFLHKSQLSRATLGRVVRLAAMQANTFRSLRDSEEQYRRLAESSPDAILIHQELRIVFVNRAMVALMRAGSAADLIGKPSTFMLRPEAATESQLRSQRLYAGEAQPRVEREYVRLDGTPVQVEVAAAPLMVEHRPAALVTVRDITERKLSEERIQYLATHDAVTGLPNRNLIQDRIAQSVNQARRAGHQTALLFIDLDRFKMINDGYGHFVGDALLKAVGERLAALVRESDTVAHLSGDEFLILLGEVRRHFDVHLVAQKALDALNKSFMLNSREIFVTASIGASVFPQDGSTADTLIGNADVAMYRAKDLGRNNFQFFTREMSDETHSRIALETKLRVAIVQDRLHLVYQPKADLATGRITGCEALLRWDDPELGSVSPARFIPIAEDSGLIVAIGDWVLRTACAQNRAWQAAGLPLIAMAVNISARQFLQHDVVAWVLDVLTESGLAPEHLELELTESLIAKDTERAVATVNRLKEAGVRFAIDDFGTGYSSLAYLKRFRVDTLKIDQSFVRNMLTDADDATIARAIIALAHNLRMRAVAEGVETHDQCQFLRLIQCDGVQGYFFGRPAPAEEFAELLRSGKRLA